MKKRMMTLITGFSLLLSGCVSSDADLVLDFVNDWMFAKGIIDENGTPTFKAAGVVSGLGTTDDHVVDAAVQAGAMLKDIRSVDKVAKEADAAAKKNPPDYDTAMKKINAAIDSRPNDWGYMNQRGGLHLAQGNTAAANADFERAKKMCGGSSRCLEAVNRDRNRYVSVSVPIDSE